MHPLFPENLFGQREGENPIRHRRAFTPKEDNRLRELVSTMGNDWKGIAQQMPGRNARQYRERWRNYLALRFNREPWTEDEDRLLVEKFMQFGPKWVRIANFFRNRSNINVKNRLNSIKKLAEKMNVPLNEAISARWRVISMQERTSVIGVPVQRDNRLFQEEPDNPQEQFFNFD
jgi:hypothetical protein